MGQTRVIVTGCRHWRCEALAERTLRRMKERYGDDLTIVHGAAPGVDTAFNLACRKLGIRREPHPADWAGLGNAAGPIRNGEMVRLGAAFVLAVHRDLAGSKGTKDCVRQAQAAGIPVWLIANDSDHPPHRLEAI